MSGQNKKYTLEDCIQKNREHPLSFMIPSREEVSQLKKGDLVKLIFNHPEGVPLPNERMWVIVHTVEGDKFTGELNNDPLTFDPLDLKDTDIVEFEGKHIAGDVLAFELHNVGVLQVQRVKRQGIVVQLPGELVAFHRVDDHPHPLIGEGHTLRVVEDQLHQIAFLQLGHLFPRGDHEGERVFPILLDAVFQRVLLVLAAHSSPPSTTVRTSPWVIVHTVEGDKFTGELNNDPLTFDPLDLKDTDIVEFEGKHIANFVKAATRH
ncbi:hypothetical protein DLP05_150 [Stenotrophomonas phage vB_SmaS_DLP_5]|uniref:Uncharacterized protein n=1 Tax=Stenotrophomonas phage vB_SmaS_DLP_5 TaxID=2044561 RepID=A0A2D2W2N2_9CAUD|nr:hypothetical protein FDJ07_gp071 [Stenotrophomonas phage vB_SmaS_DLP_5]ATS92310.1 hypothetical protein DLP05_150 [Stenotrophomonas phage vB_SmaS_DLP_5]